MRPLFLLWGCLVLPGYGDTIVGPKEVSGFEGDTMSLQCTYGDELKKFQKYWCKESGLIFSRCTSTIYANTDGQVTTKDRVSIQDSRPERALKVTLQKLSLQDAGTYWCGVSKLGIDTVFSISLLVFPGPCCPPSPAPFFRPLTTTSRRLGPMAHMWHTQAPGLRTSRPTTRLDPSSAKDPSLVTRSSSSSKPRTLVSTARFLAPVWVLVSLLLVTALAALGHCMFCWREEDEQGDLSKDKNENVHLTHVLEKKGHQGPQDKYMCLFKMDMKAGKSLRCPKGNYGPQYTLRNLALPTQPDSSPLPPSTETGCLNQTSEEDHASPLDLKGDLVPQYPLQLPGEETGFLPV